MSELKDQKISTRSLRLAANYIDCIKLILEDIFPALSSEIKSKYHIQKLEDGSIDIQFPDDYKSS